MCSFTDTQLAEFQQHLEKGFPFKDKQRVKQGILCIGKQPSEDIWVLNDEVHIDGDGTRIPVKLSKYALQPLGGPSIELSPAARGQGSKMRLDSDIQIPLESSSSLHMLLGCMRDVFKHNFIPGK